MFRLVKVINGNNQYEVVKIKVNSSDTVKPGCALTCNSSVASPTSSASSPDYIAIMGNDNGATRIDAMPVTEDMIFKVEFTGSVTPVIGMNVAIANGKYKSDSVNYNSSGKGTVLGVDDDEKLVYVRFRK